eukprot:4533508-Prymnesium_polylepis.1
MAGARISAVAYTSARAAEARGNRAGQCVSVPGLSHPQQSARASLSNESSMCCMSIACLSGAREKNSHEDVCAGGGVLGTTPACIKMSGTLRISLASRCSSSSRSVLPRMG